MNRTDSEPAPNVKRYGPKNVNPKSGQITLPRNLLKEWGIAETPGVQFDVFGNADDRSIILVQVQEDDDIDWLVLEARLKSNRKRGGN